MSLEQLDVFKAAWDASDVFKAAWVAFALADYLSGNLSPKDTHTGSETLKATGFIDSLGKACCLMYSCIMIAVPSVRIFAALASVSCGALVACRLHANQTLRPRRVFGRLAVILAAVNAFAFNWMVHVGFVANVQPAVVASLAISACLFPLYLHLSGTDIEYRRVWTHIVALGFTSSAEWTSMGRSAERLVVLAPLLATELTARVLSEDIWAAAAMPSPPESAGEDAADKLHLEHERPSAVGYIADYPFGFSFFAHSFHDRELEAQYSASVFRASYRPFVYLMAATCGACLVITALEPAPFQKVVCALTVPLLVAVTLARSTLESMEDATAARLRYSRAVAAEGVVSALSFLCAASFMHAPAFSITEPQVLNSEMGDSGALLLISTPWLLCNALVVMACPIFWWLSSVEDEHRCVWTAAIVALFLAMPPFSTTGRPVETVVMLVAIILGELFGYTLMQLHRNAFLRTRASRLTREAEDRAARAEHTSALLAVERGADSRLNHLIKSKCGASLQLAWLLRDKLRQAGLGGETSAELFATHDALLALMSTQLEAVMDWVHRRQVFVQLEANTYSSHSIQCDLRHEIDKVLGSDDGTVHIAGGAEQVLVDRNVLNILIDEAVSNARKHRDVGSRIEVLVTLENGAPDGGEDEEGGAAVGTAAATTTIAALATATPAVETPPRPAQQCLHIAIRNRNQIRAPRLTLEQCRRVFEPGYKAHCASALSDGVGLDSVAKACRVAGGRAYLRTEDADDGGSYTIFHMHLVARPILPSADEEDSDSSRPISPITPPAFTAPSSLHVTPEPVPSQGDAPFSQGDVPASQGDDPYPLPASGTTLAATAAALAAAAAAAEKAAQVAVAAAEKATVIAASAAAAAAAAAQPTMEQKGLSKVIPSVMADPSSEPPFAAYADATTNGQREPKTAAAAGGPMPSTSNLGSSRRVAASSREGPFTAGSSRDGGGGSIMCAQVFSRGRTSEPLVCLAVDDDAFLRETHTMFFEHVMGADMSHSGALGVSAAELSSFCDVALGHCSLSSVVAAGANAGAGGGRAADVLFIDHDLGLGPQLNGTELARRAAEAGFGGLTCIVTAASPAEQARIARLPYVDLVVEKGFRPTAFAKELRERMAERAMMAEAAVEGGGGLRRGC